MSYWVNLANLPGATPPASLRDIGWVFASDLAAIFGDIQVANAAGANPPNDPNIGWVNIANFPGANPPNDPYVGTIHIGGCGVSTGNGLRDNDGTYLVDNDGSYLADNP